MSTELGAEPVRSPAWCAQEKLNDLIDEAKNNGVVFYEDIPDTIRQEIKAQFSASYEADDIACDLHLKPYLTSIFSAATPERLSYHRAQLCKMIEEAFDSACKRYVARCLEEGRISAQEDGG